MREYGLVTCRRSTNLGDYVQTLAARRLTPGPVRPVYREQLDADPGADRLRTILNGWFMHHPRRWPPHASIEPLITSFHVSQGRRSRWLPLRTAAQVLLAPRNLGYLRDHGPVGARDHATLELLQAAGIESYYSSCLTLTLDGGGPRGEEIIACDLDEELHAALARKVKAPLAAVTHRLSGPLSDARRMEKAEALLARYARARAVMTSRLHCALPCLAMGTPVLFVPLLGDLYRQGPAMELAHHCSREALLRGRTDFNPNDPPVNPDRHLPLRQALISAVDAFFSRPGGPPAAASAAPPS